MFENEPPRMWWCQKGCMCRLWLKEGGHHRHWMYSIVQYTITLGPGNKRIWTVLGIILNEWPKLSTVIKPAIKRWEIHQKIYLLRLHSNKLYTVFFNKLNWHQLVQSSVQQNKQHGFRRKPHGQQAANPTQKSAKNLISVLFRDSIGNPIIKRKVSMSWFQKCNVPEQILITAWEIPAKLFLHY